MESVEVEIRVPALTTTELPDTRMLNSEVLQGASAAKAMLRFRVQPNTARYLRAQFTGGASFGNASGKTGAVALVF